MGNFNRLKVETVFSDIVFNQSNLDKLHVIYVSEKTNNIPSYVIRRDANSIHIFEDISTTYKTFSLFKSFISFGNNQAIDWEGSGKYTINLSRKLEELLINSEEGSVEIRNILSIRNLNINNSLNDVILNNFDTEESIINSFYGNIFITNTHTEKYLEIFTKSGDINISMNNTINKKIFIKTESGSINISNIKSPNIAIESIDGKINVIPETFESLFVNSRNGDVHIKLNNKNVSIRAYSNSGFIKIFDEYYENSFVKEIGDISIFVNTNEGNIIIEDVSLIK